MRIDVGHGFSNHPYNSGLESNGRRARNRMKPQAKNADFWYNVDMNSKPNDNDFDLTKFRKSLRRLIYAMDPTFESSEHRIRPTRISRQLQNNLITFLQKDVRSKNLPTELLLEDAVIILGTLAKNINSAFLPRVVEMVVDFLDANTTHKTPLEQASALVNEFVACWHLVMTETRLVDGLKMQKLWPKAPKHSCFFKSAEVNTSGMDIAEANEKIREHAWEEYLERTEQLRPSEEGERHPIECLARQLDEETKNLKDWKPFTDKAWIHLNYALLELTLATNTDLVYDSFLDPDSEDDEPETVYKYETTQEERLKNQVIDNLGAYLEVACGLAKEIDSKSYDDFARCQTLVRAHYGMFYDDDNLDDLKAKRDLEELMTLLQQSCATLWADCTNYRPPKTRDHVEELKAHVTAETNREIAAKAPKRKKKFGYEGNGMKGPKTKMMAYQQKTFNKFLEKNPVTKKYSRQARAKQCWNLHKPEWDKARYATGDNKGYASHKSLSAAK